MNLKEYLFYSGITSKEFCEIAGISHMYLSSMMTGKRNPSKRMRFYIEHITEGQVKGEDIDAPMNVPQGFIPFKLEKK